MKIISSCGMEELVLNEKACEKFLHWIDSQKVSHAYLASKHQVEYYRDEEIIFRLRLPIQFCYPWQKENHKTNLVHYVLILIRAGIATVGYFENGDNIDHKVFRAYMVRKKQGKSQIKYLKTKGKSRAGSRVRLAETEIFFQDINTRLQMYFNTHRLDRIGLACSTTLIPYFFGAKTATPFQKNDPRLFKIPKHIQNPTYESLLETNQFLQKAELKYSGLGKKILEKFLPLLEKNENDTLEDDSW